ncbi:hypothetical protein B2G71_18610 [Novosphingobium sp. PC22D]|nr:hypothetical protein B2G71_18610 [Novosphingobium sp. PC22D]
MPPLDREFFGSDRLDLEAANLFGMVEKLDELAPGFASVADVRAAFAIDGVVVHDWSASLADASEVIVLPRVGGG